MRPTRDGPSGGSGDKGETERLKQKIEELTTSDKNATSLKKTSSWSWGRVVVPICSGVITYTFCRYRKGYHPGFRAFGLGVLPFVASEAFTMIWKLSLGDNYESSKRKVSSVLTGLGTAGVLATIWKDVYQI